MGEISDKAIAFLDRKLPMAMWSLGNVTRDFITTELQILCPAYHTEYRGHHSPPGDPPYLETGALQAHVASTVLDGGGEVELTSSRPPQKESESPLVPVFLEFGTPNMAKRPYMRPAMLRGGIFLSESMKKSFTAGGVQNASGD